MPSKTSSFKKSSFYYDLLYAWKNYEYESDKLKSLIQKYKKSAGNELLEVACGTGKHLPFLQDSFSIVATDVNKDMLAIARKNLPDVTFKQANMTTLNLKKTFDVIICLFSSISYVKTYKKLDKTISHFANHLKKGGIVMIEPWFTESTYINGLPSMTIYDNEDIKISRLYVCKKRGILSIMDMHYLIAEKNQQTKHFVERHELALFDRDQFLTIMNKHGFKAYFLKNGLMKERGLYIGVKK